MNKEEAIKASRNGAIVALITVVTTSLVSSYSYFTNQTDNSLHIFNDPLIMLDILFMAVCAFGMTYRSRAAAVAAFCFFILCKIITIQNTGKFTGGFIALIFLYYYAKAIQGTFVYHKIEKQNNPEYKGAPRWSFYVGIPIVLVFFMLIILGIVIGEA